MRPKGVIRARRQRRWLPRAWRRLRRVASCSGRPRGGPPAAELHPALTLGLFVVGKDLFALLEGERYEVWAKASAKSETAEA